MWSIRKNGQLCVCTKISKHGTTNGKQTPNSIMQMLMFMQCHPLGGATGAVANGPRDLV